MGESIDFEARFKQAVKSLELKDPPKSEELDYDSDSDIPATIGYETVGGEDKSQPKLAKVTSINLFQQPEAHPVILDLALLRKYGTEWLHWEPETLVWRVPQDFRTSGVSDLNLDKIQAMKALHFNDNFWLQWEVFNWCTHPLNNMYPNFEVMQVPSTAQMMVSVQIAGTVRGDVSWSNEVKDFMAVACRYDGIFFPPAPLDFLEVGSENGFVDGKAIAAKWPDVRRTGAAPVGDTIIDEQLRRMLDAHVFLEESRSRFQDQLPLVMND